MPFLVCPFRRECQMKSRCLGLLALTMVAGTAHAQWSDNFNRPDGPIGPDWTAVSGTWAIASNQGMHTGTGVNTVLQHNSASLQYDLSVTTLDIHKIPGNTANAFVAALIGLGGTNTLMVKIQAQAGTDMFSNIGIYRATNGTGWGTYPGGLPFSVLTAPFQSARMTISFPNADTIQCDLDTNFDGTPDQTYQSAAVSTLSLGTQHGIGAWLQNATFDNWGVGPVGPTGACCLTSGASNCIVTTSASCTSLGGTYSGDNVTCAVANCAPLPTGACCRNNGTCDIVTQNQCTTTGGTYAGNNVTCAAANCAPGGACCFFATCSVLTSAACTAGGGTWQGSGSACGSCPTVPPVFYANCNISTGPTTLSGVAAAPGNLWSECAKDDVEPTLTNTTAGFTGTGTFRMADDFVVPAGGLNVGYIKVYAYHSSATPTLATGATLRILDGSPTGTPNVVFGDQTTNRMANAAFTNIYRIFPTTVGLGSGTPCVNGAPTAPGTTRRLQEIYITVNQFLPAGTYWIDYAFLHAATLFVPPATQADAIGRQCNPGNSNGLQGNNNVWGPANDAGHGCSNGVAVNNPAGTNVINSQQDLYFEVLGTAGAVPCYADCDGVGGLTANDFICFLTAFNNNQSYADCDHVGGLTANDFICFVTAYNAGCS
jgi:hypothetical protein